MKTINNFLSKTLCIKIIIRLEVPFFCYLAGISASLDSLTFFSFVGFYYFIGSETANLPCAQRSVNPSFEPSERNYTLYKVGTLNLNCSADSIFSLAYMQDPFPPPPPPKKKRGVQGFGEGGIFFQKIGSFCFIKRVNMQGN